MGACREPSDSPIAFLPPLVGAASRPVSAILGGTGTGLVCGWLAGGIAPPRGARSAVVLVAAGGVLVAEAFALAGDAAAIALLVALGLGAGLRWAWTSWLRLRAQPDAKGGA
jgi:predicted MFS family arabinose efflux permease